MKQRGQLFNILKRISINAMLMAVACAGLLPAHASSPDRPGNPTELPQQGVSTNGLDRNAIRILYHNDTKKLEFTGVRSVENKDIQTVTATTGGTGNSATAQVTGFEKQNTPQATEWIVMVDNSGSMCGRRRNTGNRRYLDEAINYAIRLTDSLKEGDTLSVHLFSQDMKQLGETVNGGDRQAKANLKNTLDTEGRKGTSTGNTAMYHLMWRYVYKLNRTPVEANRTRAILLLTDGDDETSDSDKINDLIAEATGKAIKIHAVVLCHINIDEDGNDVDTVCTKTEGSFNSAPREHTAAEQESLIKTIYEAQRAAGGSCCKFLVDVSGISAGTPLNITCLSANRETVGTLSITAEALAQICSIRETPPTPSTEETGDIWPKLIDARAALITYEGIETAQPQNFDKTDESAAQLRSVCESLKEPLLKFKAAPAEQREAYLRTITPTAQLQNMMAALKAFCNNTAITPETLSEKEILTILGREKPLPSPHAPAAYEMLKRINLAEPLLADSERAEDPQAQQQVLNQLKDALQKLKEQAVILKKLPQDQLLLALEEMPARFPQQPEYQARVDRLKQFCQDSGITSDNISEAHLLALLGRNTPLPTPAAANPAAEQEEGTSIWVYILFGLVLLIIVTIVVILLKPKEKASFNNTDSDIKPIAPVLPVIPEEEDEPTRKVEEEKPAPAIPERQSNTVPAGTPGIPLHSVLGTVTTQDGEFWLLARQITIGKHQSCDICISNKTVSHTHCCLKWIARGHWQVIDMKSTNGVYFNRRKHSVLDVTTPASFELGSARVHLNPKPF